jgi:hypothetical protein
MAKTVWLGYVRETRHPPVEIVTKKETDMRDWLTRTYAENKKFNTDATPYAEEWDLKSGEKTGTLLLIRNNTIIIGSE